MKSVSPGLDHIDATQHLTHDDLDVLVVDLHALQSIDVLHFVDDVASQGLDPLQTQDVMRIDRTIDDDLALLHHLSVVHGDVLVLGDQVLVRHAVQIGNDQALLALGVLAEGDRSGHFGQHAGILRRTRFEQLGYARQTPGNVAGLRGFLREYAPAHHRR
jgi:hypothetical protein